MFFSTREKMLESLRKMGAASCPYDFQGAWPDNRCDCKYGADNFRENAGEQTGCPELRSMHEALATMSDADWYQTILAAGGVCFEYMKEAPRKPGAETAAAELARYDIELARTLGALYGAQRPVLEGVLAALPRDKQVLLGLMGFGLGDDSEGASPHVSAWGLQVIAACAVLFPPLDTDVDAAMTALQETMTGDLPESKAG